MTLQLNDKWDFPVDNNFAANIVSHLAAPVYNRTGSNSRCAECQQQKFWTPHFSITDSWKGLEDRKSACDFCRLRWEVCSDLDRGDFPDLRFDRDESMLKLNGRYPPVLSIRRALGESDTTKYSARDTG